MISVKTEGGMPLDAIGLEYKRLSHPVYPLDETEFM